MNTPLLDPNTALQAGWLKESLKDGQYHCRCGQVSIALCWVLVYGVLVYGVLVYCVISYPPPPPPCQWPHPQILPPNRTRIALFCLVS